MTTTKQNDGSLLLTYDGSLASKWAVGITIVLLGTAVYDHFIGARGDDRMVALLASAAMAALMALVLLEQSRFRLDPATRLVEWDTRWGFSRRSGLLKFADIQHVSVDVPIGDSGVPSRRVVLHLSDGTLLPLTKGYQPDIDDAIQHAAEAIRGTLGQPAPTSGDSARALLAHGKTVDAVKLLVDRDGLSLTEARQRVDAMRHDRRN